MTDFEGHSAKQEYRKLMDSVFKGLQLRQPMFYNWGVALRFNLQHGATGTDEYFREVIRRAVTIFQAVFSPTDNVLVVLTDSGYRRKKIRFSNYAFRQVIGLQRKDVSYSRFSNLYEAGDSRNVALFKTYAHRINCVNILSAIGNTDLPPRNPRLDKKYAFSSKEIYFINLSKNIIFNMYDDRGLDVIAVDRELLKPIYIAYNDWLLDYDRQKMNEQFE